MHRRVGGGGGGGGCGSSYPDLTFLRSCILGFVPKDCLDAFPDINTYLARVEALPAIAEWEHRTKTNQNSKQK